MLKDRRSTSIVYTTYDGRYYIRQKYSEINSLTWVLAECGNIMEKTYVGSLEECKQYIYNNLTDDHGHKYKIEHVNELNMRTYTRIPVNYNVRIKNLTSGETLFLNAKMDNVSSGGCKIAVLSNVYPNLIVDDKVMIEFNRNDFNLKGIENYTMKGLIRWTLGAGNKFGCQFIEMNSDSEKLLSAILEKLVLEDNV